MATVGGYRPETSLKLHLPSRRKQAIYVTPSFFGCGNVRMYAQKRTEGTKMTIDEYERLQLEERDHFAKGACGEIFDRRSLDEVLFDHTDHKNRPDMPYSVSFKTYRG
jgi:hypothetical protein